MLEMSVPRAMAEMTLSLQTTFVVLCDMETTSEP